MVDTDHTQVLVISIKGSPNDTYDRDEPCESVEIEHLSACSAFAGSKMSASDDMVADISSVSLGLWELDQFAGEFASYDGFAIVYSTVSYATFEAVSEMYEAICRQKLASSATMGGTVKHHHVPAVIMGYMLEDDDEQANERVVPMRDGMRLARSMNCPFIEFTSIEKDDELKMKRGDDFQLRWSGGMTGYMFEDGILLLGQAIFASDNVIVEKLRTQLKEERASREKLMRLVELYEKIPGVPFDERLLQQLKESDNKLDLLKRDLGEMIPLSKRAASSSKTHHDPREWAKDRRRSLLDNQQSKTRITSQIEAEHRIRAGLVRIIEICRSSGSGKVTLDKCRNEIIESDHRLRLNLAELSRLDEANTNFTTPNIDDKNIVDVNSDTNMQVDPYEWARNRRASGTLSEFLAADESRPTTTTPIHTVILPKEKNIMVQQEPSVLDKILNPKGKKLVKLLGRLTVKVVNACNLGRICDPFAILSLGKQQARTKKCKRTEDAIWDQQFNFDVTNLQDYLSIAVFDWGLFLRDDFLGQLKLPLLQLPPGKTINEKFKLYNRSGSHSTIKGTMRIAILYEPVTDKLSMADFEILSVIGKGGYGKVMQVRKLDNGRIYAMKVVKKAALSKKGQISLQREKAVMEQLSHPFVMELLFSFQSEVKLYFVLDYINGGDLYFHLQRDVYFAEDRTRFYAGELFLALEYLHDLGILYRDLKLENVLLDHFGHIRLIDFGMSKPGLTDSTSTKTICGTPDYIAPELLLKAPYNKSIDFWSFGILIWEMLNGRPPFEGSSLDETFQNILHSPIEPLLQKLEHQRAISPAAEMLLVGLLQRCPDFRLSASEIRKHKFFSGICWEDLENKLIVPPYKPRVKDELDLHNFDSKLVKEQPKDSIEEAPINEAVAKMFKGFTFARFSGVFNNFDNGVDSDFDSENVASTCSEPPLDRKSSSRYLEINSKLEPEKKPVTASQHAHRHVPPPPDTDKNDLPRKKNPHFNTMPARAVPPHSSRPVETNTPPYPGRSQTIRPRKIDSVCKSTPPSRPNRAPPVPPLPTSDDSALVADINTVVPPAIPPRSEHPRRSKSFTQGVTPVVKSKSSSNTTADDTTTSVDVPPAIPPRTHRHSASMISKMEAHAITSDKVSSVPCPPSRKNSDLIDEVSSSGAYNDHHSIYNRLREEGEDENTPGVAPAAPQTDSEAFVNAAAMISSDPMWESTMLDSRSNNNIYSEFKEEDEHVSLDGNGDDPSNFYLLPPKPVPVPDPTPAPICKQYRVQLYNSTTSTSAQHLLLLDSDGIILREPSTNTKVLSALYQNIWQFAHVGDTFALGVHSVAGERLLSQCIMRTADSASEIESTLLRLLPSNVSVITCTIKTWVGDDVLVHTIENSSTEQASSKHCAPFSLWLNQIMLPPNIDVVNEKYKDNEDKKLSTSFIRLCDISHRLLSAGESCVAAMGKTHSPGLRTLFNERRKLVDTLSGHNRSSIESWKITVPIATAMDLGTCAIGILRDLRWHFAASLVTRTPSLDIQKKTVFYNAAHGLMMSHDALTDSIEESFRNHISCIDDAAPPAPLTRRSRTMTNPTQTSTVPICDNPGMLSFELSGNNEKIGEAASLSTTMLVSDLPSPNCEMQVLPPKVSSRKTPTKPLYDEIISPIVPAKILVDQVHIISSWSVHRVETWLKDLGLSTYAPAFVNSKVDGAKLLSLSIDELVALGMTKVGHVRKFRFSVDKLRTREQEQKAGVN